MDYEEYNLSVKKFLFIIPVFWESYHIEILIDDIIEYYINDEDDIVKNLFTEYTISGRAELRDKLIISIQNLNDMQSNEYRIRRNKKSIKIPSNIDFFRLVFPEYHLMIDTSTKISTDIRVLKELNYSPSLEQIVKGESLEINSEGRMEINIALHRMKIYSCPDADTDKLTEATLEGVEIFQKEYMDRQRDRSIRYVENSPQEPSSINSRRFSNELGLSDGSREAYIEEWSYSYISREICANTLLLLNRALKEGWTRELYFYYIPVAGDPSEAYINDANIDEGVYDNLDRTKAEKMYPANGTTLYAKSHSDSTETLMGTVRFFPNGSNIGHRGIMHNATKEFFPRNNSERICWPTIISEGGGYDSINTYDSAYLSIGIIQWNWERLYNLLMGFKRNHRAIFEQLISGPYKLDVKVMEGGAIVDVSSSNRRINTENKRFEIDGVAYTLNPRPTALKKLRFVYCFIKAAGNNEFQTWQNMDATEEYIHMVLALRINDRPITAYVTSEMGMAFVYDHYVNAERYTVRCVEKAVTEVIFTLKNTWNDNMLRGLNNADREWVRNNLSLVLNESDKEKLDGFINNPANWRNYEENLLLNAYERIRTVQADSGMDRVKAIQRNNRIKESRFDLSRNRDSFTP
jgi:hypothetical protein